MYSSIEQSSWNVRVSGSLYALRKTPQYPGALRWSNPSTVPMILRATRAKRECLVVITTKAFPSREYVRLWLQAKWIIFISHLPKVPPRLNIQKQILPAMPRGSGWCKTVYRIAIAPVSCRSYEFHHRLNPSIVPHVVVLASAATYDATSLNGTMPIAHGKDWHKLALL